MQKMCRSIKERVEQDVDIEGTPFTSRRLAFLGGTPASPMMAFYSYYRHFLLSTTA